MRYYHNFRISACRKFNCEPTSKLYDTIISSQDRGKYTHFVFGDIFKTFNRVWHQGLIRKLQGLGFEGNTLDWNEDYLIHRQQKVTLDGFSSTSKILDAEVAQTSVLGPFFLVIC